ncbi:peptidoglycan-binding protein [Aquamicrobium ahrensii]|uniref:Peptidoglycan binding-like domain-containing protein n=1 Tax=Aquamicrobium ahrensii TaxID=469551 RepID=A0ABV2KRA6_9HYPH
MAGAECILRFLRRGLFGAFLVVPAALASAQSTPGNAQGLDRLLQELLIPSRPILRPDPGHGVQPRSRQQPQGTRMDAQSVRSMQNMLNGLGYDAGNADGVFGARTLGALNQFQRDYGLPLSRMPDTQSLATLSAVYNRSDQTAPRNQQAEFGQIQPTHDPEILANQPGFDCEQARASDELAVCASATLRHLDSQMSANYAQLIKDASEADAAHWRNTQRAFLEKRQACGSEVPCLTLLYEDRIAELGFPPSGELAEDQLFNDTPAVLQASGAPLSPELDALLSDLVKHQGLPTADSLQPRKPQGLSGLIGLLRLGEHPEILNHDATAETHARAYLRGRRRDALLNTYRGWAGDNEFEKKRSYEEFVTQDAVRLRAIAPKLPLTVVLTGRLGLESYDMARKAFPLNSSGGPMQLFDAPHSVGPQFALPDSLPVDAAAAEDVLQRMENRNLWMAATVTITRIGQQTGDISYRLERLVGYADRGLTDLVYEFPRAQAPVAGSEGESLAVSESVPLMGDTLLLAAINAGLPPARPIDWVQETRLRFGIERSIYRIDHGANWKQHDPWGPFFPASAQTWEGQETAYEQWTRKRAQALSKNLVVRSLGALRIGGSGGSDDVEVESDLPAVLPRIALSTFFVRDENARVGGANKSALDELIARTVGGGANRLIFVSRGEQAESGALLFDRPVSDYRFPVDREKLEAAVRQLPEKDYRSFEVLLTVERGEARRLKRGEVELMVLPVTPKSAEVVVGGKVIATSSFNLSDSIQYGAGDQTIEAPEGRVMPLNAETMDLLALRHVPQSISDQDWERMFWSRYEAEKSSYDKELRWGEFFRNIRFAPEAKDMATLLADFRKWSASRAARLPDQFTISFPRNRAKVVRLPGVWRIKAQNGIENHIQACRNNPDTDLNDCDRLEASFGMQDRTVHLKPRSECGPNDAYCHATLKILKKLGEDTWPVELFELTQQIDTALAPSQGRNQDIQVTIAVLGARIGDEVAPSVFAEAGWNVEGPSVALPAPVFQISLIDAALVDATTRNVAQQLAIGPIRLDMPEPREEKSTVRVYDIIGISLGDDFETAEAVIRKHMAVGRVFEGIRAHDGSIERGMVTPATSGKLFVSPNGKEMIGLIDEPPAIEGRVAAAWRRIYFDPSTVPEVEINESLLQKYGAPYTGQMGQGSNVWFAAGKETQCSNQTYIYNTVVQALSAAWTDGNPAPTLVIADGSLIHDAKLPERMRNPLKRSPTRQPDCGEVFSSEVNFNASRTLKAGYPSGSMDWVETILTDADAYARAFVQNREAAQQAAGAGGEGATSGAQGGGVKF